MKTKFYSLTGLFFLLTVAAYSQSLAGHQTNPSSQSTHTVAPPSNEQLVVPNTVNYQAVARNSSGGILANQLVGLRLTIEDGAGGAILYQERQTPTTNQFGLLTVKLGSGTVLSGTWAAINWANGNQWLKVDMDPTGGSSYTTMGESELLAVPFSNYSKATAAVAGTTDYIGKFTSGTTIGDSRIYDNGINLDFGTSTGNFSFNFESAQYSNVSTHNTNAGAGEVYFYANRSGSTDNGGLAIGSGGNPQWTVAAMATDNLSVRNWVLGTDAISILFSNNNIGIGTATPAHRLEVAQGTASQNDNQGNSTLYNYGFSAGNALYLESNETGDNTGTTAYSQAQLAGWNSNTPFGGMNAGVWGTVTGAGSGGYGVIGSYGTIGSETTYAGLGGPFYAGYFVGNTYTNGLSTINAPTGLGTSYDNGDLVIESTSGQWPRMGMVQLPHTSGYGLTMFGKEAAGGGLQVVTADQTAWAPVEASAFTVMSDRRMKNSIEDIKAGEYDAYMAKIRGIESARFFYNYETERKTPHIGLISQTLPVEVQAEMSDIGGAKAQERIGVNLADLAGLTLVGVKALDNKQQQLEKEIADLKAEIQRLRDSK
jgi:hypothetical protein